MATKPVTIQIYFDDEKSPLYKKVSKLNKQTGLSVSKIAYYALQVGLPEVAENIKGLHLDFEVMAESKERKNRS